MKNFFCLLAFAAVLTACGGPEGEAVSASAAEEVATTAMVASTQYNVDPAASSVNWEGTKLVGEGHTGTIPVTSGKLMVANDKIVGGEFYMAIKDLTNTDMPAAEGGDKLVGHLLSADFFDAEKFPMAQFTVTNVQPVTGEDHTHDITGNLMLKGETRSVTLPATVSMDGGMLKASTPKFTINRKDWGMNYGSDDIEGLAKDKIISNDVGLELTLVASK